MLAPLAPVTSDKVGSKRSGKRNPLHGIPIFGLYIAGGLLLPGKRRIVPYSIQWLKRLRPRWFREDLSALLNLLQENRIKPLIAQRLPLAQARHAHELLGKGGVTGKIVLEREAVEAHGGHISADSQVGHGSTFKFELPVAAGDGRKDP